MAEIILAALCFIAGVIALGVAGLVAVAAGQGAPGDNDALILINVVGAIAFIGGGIAILVR